MKKYIVTNAKGLRFQDQGKDFQLKNGQEFEANPTAYMAYLVKAKFIKEVVAEVEVKKAETPEKVAEVKAENPEVKAKEAEKPAQPKVKKSTKK